MAIIFSGVAIVFYHWTCMYKMPILACRSAGAFALLEVAAQRILGTQSTFGHVVCAKGGKTFSPLGTCVSQVVVEKLTGKQSRKFPPENLPRGVTNHVLRPLPRCCTGCLRTAPTDT